MRSPFLFLTLLCSLIIEINADGPYCHTCESIINDIKTQYRNNFKYVTPSQLQASLFSECDKNFGGPADTRCRDIASENVDLILYELQQGHYPYYVCMTILPPLC